MEMTGSATLAMTEKPTLEMTWKAGAGIALCWVGGKVK